MNKIKGPILRTRPAKVGLFAHIPPLLMVTAACCAMLILAIAPASAQATQSTFDIPAQSLAAALLKFSTQSGISVALPHELAEGHESKPLVGVYSSADALRKLLEGSGLQFEFIDPDTVRITLAKSDKRGELSAPQPPARAVQTVPLPDGLDEVVVTARRRTEKLQEVPIAITAFTAQALTEQHIQNITDLGYLVPSLSAVINGNRDQQYFTLRGIQNQPGGPGVVVYFNDVPDFSPGQNGALGNGGGGTGPGKFLDLENVQVLKGPQGTLFGRNSVGGAILIDPKKPTGNFEGYVQATFGNYNNIDLEAAINVPVVADKLFVRFSGERAQRDGFTTDLQSGKDLDNRDYWVERVSVVFRPTDYLENYLVADDSYSHTNGTSNVLYAADPCFLLAPGISLGKCGLDFAVFPNVAQLLAAQQAAGPGKVVGQFSDNAIGPLDKFTHLSISDITTWNIDDNITLKNIFGYQDFKHLLRESYAPFPADDTVTPGGWSSTQSEYTDELQIQGRSLGDSLVWQAGIYGSFEHTTGANNLTSNLFGSLSTTAGGDATRSEAVYAQETYDLGNVYAPLDGLKFTAGYRYTWDFVSSTGYGPCGSNSPPACLRTAVASGDAAFEAPSWTLSLDYKITPSTLVYVTGRRGYIGGGVNQMPVPGVPTRYAPEYIDDAEIGIKSDWELWGVKSRTNVDAFRSYFKAIQNSTYFFDETADTFVNAIENNGKVTVSGLEFEGTFIPDALPGFQLLLNYSYNYAHYNVVNAVLQPGLVLDPTISGVPPHKVSVSASQILPWIPEADGQVKALVTWNYQSHSNDAGILNYAAFSNVAAFGLVNLRLDWDNVLGEPLNASFFMTNALNRRYWAGDYPVFEFLGFMDQTFGEPRMFGVQLRYSFGPTAAAADTATVYEAPPVVTPTPASPKSYLVFFDFNRSDLTPQAETIVDQAAKNAGPAKVTRLEVTGHTDTVGSDAYNMRLSRRRAESVAAQLEKDGIPSGEIEIVAKGKRDLLVPTADGVKEPQNRRVQIVYEDGATS
jgi:iron complex outermembrane receptor protein